MRGYFRAAMLPMCFFALLAPVMGQQQRLDPRQMYERLMCVVPMVGLGSFEEPKRPMFTPTPAALRTAAASRTGVLGFSYVVSDDGLLALVEFVARDRSAFQQILASPTVKSFVKGKDKWSFLRFSGSPSPAGVPTVDSEAIAPAGWDWFGRGFS